MLEIILPFFLNSVKNTDVFDIIKAKKEYYGNKI